MKLNTETKERLLYVYLLPVLLFLIFVLYYYPVFSMQIDLNGDPAASGLQILRAGQFKEFLGQYSRTNINHPGPIMWYYISGMQCILFFCSAEGAIYLSLLILNCAFILCSMHILSSFLRKNEKLYTLLFFISILVAFIPLWKDFLLSLWEPNMKIIPVLLFIVSASATASGSLKYLLPLVISAVFIIHLHVSGIVIVGPLLLLTIFLFIKKHHKGKLKLSKKERITSIVAIVFVIIAFLPVIYEQKFSDEGNIMRIYDFFQKHPGIQHSIADTTNYTMPFFNKPIEHVINTAPVKSVNYFVIILVLLIPLYVFKMNNVDLKRLLFFIYVSIIVALFCSANIVGSMNEYLLWWFYSVVGLLYFFNLIVIFKILEKVNIQKSLILLCLLIAVVLIFAQVGQPNTADYQRYNEKYAQIYGFINPHPNTTTYLYWKAGSPNHYQWGTATGLAYKLVKNGYSVCVPDGWRTMFGKDLLCKGKTNLKTFYLFGSQYFNATEYPGAEYLDYKGTVILRKPEDSDEPPKI